MQATEKDSPMRSAEFRTIDYRSMTVCSTATTDVALMFIVCVCRSMFYSFLFYHVVSPSMHTPVYLLQHQAVFDIHDCHCCCTSIAMLSSATQLFHAWTGHWPSVHCTSISMKPIDDTDV